MAMKHAGPEALDQLEGLLDELRGLDGLREKGRGAFFVHSRSLLHFHEDSSGLYADLREHGRFVRLPVTTPRQRQLFVKRVRRDMVTDQPVAR
jgi:hypothetical protein